MTLLYRKYTNTAEVSMTVKQTYRDSVDICSPNMGVWCENYEVTIGLQLDVTGTLSSCAFTEKTNRHVSKVVGVQRRQGDAKRTNDLRPTEINRRQL